jgi:hypothetical protein
VREVHHLADGGGIDTGVGSAPAVSAEAAAMSTSGADAGPAGGGDRDGGGNGSLTTEQVWSKISTESAQEDPRAAHPSANSGGGGGGGGGSSGGGGGGDESPDAMDGSNAFSRAAARSGPQSPSAVRKLQRA